MVIDVVDLFAGPGGLGEGFASYPLAEKRRKLFNIVVSVERGSTECETLRLRSFARKLFHAHKEESYIEYLKKPIPEEFSRLVSKHPKLWNLAKDEILNKEISAESHQEILKAILSRRNEENPLILIGGPPCQAYSLVGRARNSKHIKENPDEWKKDARHTLYKEYMRFIADLNPDVFVMENVKGILSASHEGGSVFEAVREGLTNIGDGYKLYAMTTDADNPINTDFLIKSEDYGIPQARHRVILVGVSTHITKKIKPLNKHHRRISVEEVIGDLPPLRSSFSKKSQRNDLDWSEYVTQQLKQHNNGKTPYSSIEIPKSIGGEWVEFSSNLSYRTNWFRALNINGVPNHSTRSHMKEDIARYTFCSVFAKNFGRSPKLEDFPTGILPMHKNIDKESVRKSIFTDRFKVQLKDCPSSTITSHISKDGHYYIHYDPIQARSLTVREAARLQTFPDDYRFEGNRTSQYHQVGNAVPPLLAYQIAERVAELFE